LPRSGYKLTQTHLTLSALPDVFTLKIITSCAPKDNTQLMGLYVSGGRFCTQCEAEGFRRITYFPDRPDVLSIFGNLTDSGDLAGGRHFAVWDDPFRKPCYLFALVAGKFDRIEDSFTTMSARDIPLEIFVDPGDAPRALYAMDALKRSMKWDEEAFGREYDLDRFMIVAVWTGNRITCRDWFQLCLKEGFTVYRDQEFSAHERGAPLQRIKDVKALRARQFPEDAGPLAHPVRPNAYLKIDNFYTATIYEKGAEIIRMLATILGPDDFRKGCEFSYKRLTTRRRKPSKLISNNQQNQPRDSQKNRPYQCR